MNASHEKGTGRIAALALVALTLLGCASSTTAQQSPFDAIAAEAAAATVKAARKHSLYSKVLVADFTETKGHPTSLGPELASQFFASLKTHAQNLILADRDEYLRQFAADRLSAQSYQDPVTMRCYAAELDAAFVVTGELDELDDRVVVWIKVFRIENRELVFEKRVSVPLSRAMEQLLKREPELYAFAKLNPSAADFHGRTSVPRGGADGYSLPVCLNCPNASFSDGAVKEKISGTVVMNARVGANGLIEDVVIVHGLPCGLNKQAIDSVRTWKMRPATGPDGQPAAVLAQLEMTFRLY